MDAQPHPEDDSFSVTNGMIGKCPEILALHEQIHNAAKGDVNVTIIGESGTGKELVARALHDNSKRKNGPFVAVNIAAVAENLSSSELFGHEKGAFTNALRMHKGFFEQANHGTLFFDEIAKMKKLLQGELLRALENPFRRTGGTKEMSFDFRLVTASSEPLDKKVHDNIFSPELYFRIKGTQIYLPPLRERGDDIILLTHSFANEYCRQQNVKHPPALTDDAIGCLMKYYWPGNVRELKTTIENVIAMNPKKTKLNAEDFESEFSYSLVPGNRRHHSGPYSPQNGDRKTGKDEEETDSDASEKNMELTSQREQALLSIVERLLSGKGLTRLETRMLIKYPVKEAAGRIAVMNQRYSKIKALKAELETACSDFEGEFGIPIGIVKEVLGLQELTGTGGDGKGNTEENAAERQDTGINEAPGRISHGTGYLERVEERRMRLNGCYYPISIAELVAEFKDILPLAELSARIKETKSIFFENFGEKDTSLSINALLYLEAGNIYQLMSKIPIRYPDIYPEYAGTLDRLLDKIENGEGDMNFNDIASVPHMFIHYHTDPKVDDGLVDVLHLEKSPEVIRFLENIATYRINGFGQMHYIALTPDIVLELAELAVDEVTKDGFVNNMVESIFTHYANGLGKWHNEMHPELGELWLTRKEVMDYFGYTQFSSLNTRLKKEGYRVTTRLDNRKRITDFLLLPTNTYRVEKSRNIGAKGRIVETLPERLDFAGLRSAFRQYLDQDSDSILARNMIYKTLKKRDDGFYEGEEARRIILYEKVRQDFREKLVLPPAQ